MDQSKTRKNELLHLAPKITGHLPPVSTGAAPAAQTGAPLLEEQRTLLARNQKITHRQKADTELLETDERRQPVPDALAAPRKESHGTETAERSYAGRAGSAQHRTVKRRSERAYGTERLQTGLGRGSTRARRPEKRDCLALSLTASVANGAHTGAPNWSWRPFCFSVLFFKRFS